MKKIFGVVLSFLVTTLVLGFILAAFLYFVALCEVYHFLVFVFAAIVLIWIIPQEVESYHKED